MLRLGHIDYSNCLPIHAALLECPPANVEIVHGTPGELNHALETGAIDVAPCSSIEFARHPGSYHLLPDLVIGSAGAVQSIRFESTRPIESLDRCRIAVPTASATSVVLLRALLELRHGLRPEYEWYSQESGGDPVSNGFDAALWIGDIALRRTDVSERVTYDLGTLWTEWTGLPFAFALWQSRVKEGHEDELAGLLDLMRRSRAQSLQDPEALAIKYAAALRLSPERLASYWRGLRYALDARMIQGLHHFYECAVDLGEIERIPSLRFL
jgi:chorismate dehydratase